MQSDVRAYINYPRRDRYAIYIVVYYKRNYTRRDRYAIYIVVC